jgi:hypothetical protein
MSVVNKRYFLLWHNHGGRLNMHIITGHVLTQGPTSKHLALVYGQAPYLSTSSSTSGRACSGLNPYVGP